MRAAADNSFARVLNPHGGAYMLSSTDRLFRSIRTLQCIYIYIYIYTCVSICDVMVLTTFSTLDSGCVRNSNKSKFIAIKGRQRKWQSKWVFIYWKSHWQKKRKKKSEILVLSVGSLRATSSRIYFEGFNVVNSPLKGFSRNLKEEKRFLLPINDS